MSDGTGEPRRFAAELAYRDQDAVFVHARSDNLRTLSMAHILKPCSGPSRRMWPGTLRCATPRYARRALASFTQQRPLCLGVVCIVRELDTVAGRRLGFIKCAIGPNDRIVN